MAHILLAAVQAVDHTGIEAVERGVDREDAVVGVGRDHQVIGEAGRHTVYL